MYVREGEDGLYDYDGGCERIRFNTEDIFVQSARFNRIPHTHGLLGADGWLDGVFERRSRGERGVGRYWEWVFRNGTDGAGWFNCLFRSTCFIARGFFVVVWEGKRHGIVWHGMAY
jgi:hypothetical protein